MISREPQILLLHCEHASQVTWTVVPFILLVLLAPTFKSSCDPVQHSQHFLFPFITRFESE